ncbi:methyltransferase type 11, partial [Flavobacterium sp.]|uniref:methyltransferase type 11 n=1 Tax=Flavobacterium sp. TaxID=239 RepID=UPI003C430259
MVEVYKTNITKQKQAKQVIKKLLEKFPHYQINFDWEDCDRILRIENLLGQFDSKLIIDLIHNDGYFIEELS